MDIFFSNGNPRIRGQFPCLKCIFFLKTLSIWWNNFLTNDSFQIPTQQQPTSWQATFSTKSTLENGMTPDDGQGPPHCKQVMEQCTEDGCWPNPLNCLDCLMCHIKWGHLNSPTLCAYVVSIYGVSGYSFMYFYRSGNTKTAFNTSLFICFSLFFSYNVQKILCRNTKISLLISYRSPFLKNVLIKCY